MAELEFKFTFSWPQLAKTLTVMLLGLLHQEEGCSGGRSSGLFKDALCVLMVWQLSAKSRNCSCLARRKVFIDTFLDARHCTRYLEKLSCGDIVGHFKFLRPSTIASFPEAQPAFNARTVDHIRFYHFMLN